jgi:hypothetical protein
VTRKQDDITQRHERILGARAGELLKECWSPKIQLDRILFQNLWAGNWEVTSGEK